MKATFSILALAGPYNTALDLRNLREQSNTRELTKMYCSQCGSYLDNTMVFCERCGKKLSAKTAAAPPQTTPLQPIEHLRTMQPRDFEVFITQLLGRLGFRAETTRYTQDGGIDVWAVDERPLSAGRVIVQCKRYGPENTVGEVPLRELYGLVHAHGVNKGVMVTTSRFTKAAHAFADGKPIELLDVTALLSLIEANPGILPRIAHSSTWRYSFDDFPRIQEELQELKSLHELPPLVVSISDEALFHALTNCATYGWRYSAELLSPEVNIRVRASKYGLLLGTHVYLKAAALLTDGVRGTDGNYLATFSGLLLSKLQEATVNITRLKSQDPEAVRLCESHFHRDEAETYLFNLRRSPWKDDERGFWTDEAIYAIDSACVTKWWNLKRHDDASEDP